jgi:hypothetical protein
MPTYLEVPTGDNGFIKVEVDTEGPLRVGAGDVLGRASERFDEALAQIIRMGEAAIERARAATAPPDAIDIELGLKLTAKTGFVIAGSSGEANFKVVLKWSMTDRETAAR